VLSQRILLHVGFWFIVCGLSISGNSAEHIKMDYSIVDNGENHVDSVSSGQYFIDGLEKGPVTGQTITKEGHVVPFLYSDAVLKEGCFSCYSTVLSQNAHSLESLTVDSYDSHDIEGTVQYAKIDTLVVVYPHYYRNKSVRMDLSTADIETLKSEVGKSRRFLWRSSNLKCLMDTEANYMVIDRTITPAQLWDVYGGGRYWLTFWSIDGTTSVEQDLYNAGIVDGQYSVVIVLYAFENSDGATAAVGGAMYGVDIGFMGNTAYIAIPLAWGFDLELTITHEYLHALDSIYTSSGNPSGNDMLNPDHPELFPYAADNDRHYYFLMCNVLDPESWLQLDPEWARLSAAPDNDSDGVPDSGDMPITEETLGSLPTKNDTDNDGLSDADELNATFYRESSPLRQDSDSDGLLDGEDPYPLYVCNDHISQGEPLIDGFIREREYVEVVRFNEGNPDISATVYAMWSRNTIYLAVNVTDNIVGTPYQDPFWIFNDNFEVNIDSRQDGWAFKNDRNYQFYIVPTGSGRIPHVSGYYQSYIVGSPEWHEIDVSTLSTKYALHTNGYTIEMAIPAIVMPGVNVDVGSSLRLTFWVTDYDAYADWPKLNIFTGLGGDVSGFIKVYLISPLGNVGEGFETGDFKTVD
jgi:hypothetical protein